MSFSADITADITAATLDVDAFAEFTFGMIHTQAGTVGDYDTLTGVFTSTAVQTPGKIILIGDSLIETDGESVKVNALRGILLRSFLPGVEIEIDDQITVTGGAYAGRWVVLTRPDSSVVHFDLSLGKLS